MTPALKRTKSILSQPPLIVRVQGIPHVPALIAHDGKRVHIHLVDRALTGLKLPPEVSAEILRRADALA